MRRKSYNFFVYIMASPSGTLYVGVTNDLTKRVTEHKEGNVKGFTQRYGCKRLVYYEQHQYIYNAIDREKEIKNLIRKKKEEMIREINPHWDDLSDGLILRL